MGDGAGNCAGQTRYERIVQEGVCGRHSCAYYAYSKPSSRWAGASTGGSKDSSISDGTVSVRPSVLAGPGEATIGRQQYRPAAVHGRRDPPSTRHYGRGN